MIRILWTQKQDAEPPSRNSASMAYDSGRGRTVLYGGQNSNGPLGDTWEWDGANWTQMADAGPPARFGAATAFDAARNQTVIFSGSNGEPDTWGWDGSNWTQLADSGPSSRASSAMAYDSNRQRSVLFGGTSSGANIGDTWEWDGTAWTQVAETGPGARSFHSIAYDSGRDRTVLFGGFTGQAQVIILNALGGSVAQGVILGDTWEWDGSVWTQVSDFGATPVCFGGLAFKGDSVALFGGASGSGESETEKDVAVGGVVLEFEIVATTTWTLSNESTWTWSGKNWTLRQVFGPSPRYGHNLVYDTKRGTLVLFGGNSSASTYLGDTWEHSEG
jgi:hypothetical protein